MAATSKPSVSSTTIKPPVFSVGHSSHQPEQFLALLQKNSINRLVDVRSSPGSMRFPQYNMDNLKQLVESAGIEYTHQKILGGREKGGDVSFRLQSDPEVSKALLRAVNRSDLISASVSAAKENNNDAAASSVASKSPTVNLNCALMCSEANWHDCHRQNLIHYLVNQVDVKCVHIWPDGKLEEHKKGEMVVKLTQKDDETARLVEAMQAKQQGGEQKNVIAQSQQLQGKAQQVPQQKQQSESQTQQQQQEQKQQVPKVIPGAQVVQSKAKKNRLQ